MLAWIILLQKTRKSDSRDMNAYENLVFFFSRGQTKIEIVRDTTRASQFSADPHCSRSSIRQRSTTRKWLATPYLQHTLTSWHVHDVGPFTFRAKLTSNSEYYWACIESSNAYRAAHAVKGNTSLWCYVIREVARYGKTAVFMIEQNVRHNRVDDIKHGMIMVELYYFSYYFTCPLVLWAPFT